MFNDRTETALGTFYYPTCGTQLGGGVHLRFSPGPKEDLAWQKGFIGVLEKRKKVALWFCILLFQCPGSYVFSPSSLELLVCGSLAS